MEKSAIETASTVRRKFRSSLAVLGVVGLVLIQGCDEAIILEPDAVSEDDSCSHYRAVIAEARSSDIQQQQENAAAGMLFGAIVGGLLAGGDDLGEGMMWGAATGALVGYSATYFEQKAQRFADGQSLLQSVNSDAAAENQLVTKTGKAAASLRSCRIKQIDTLTSQVKSGSVEKSVARRELAALKRWINDDNKLISAALNGIGERVSAYVDATNQVVELDGAISTASARSRAPSVAKANSGHSTLLNRDAREREAIDSRIEALDVLLR